MIVVDSSVLIRNLRYRGQRAEQLLHDTPIDLEEVILGDLVLMEVLQGSRDEGHAARLELRLREFPVVQMLNADIATIAARNYRLLRSRGITIRKLPDLVIGTFCIEHGHVLLHDDRDFEPMARHLGLRTYR